jgi:hypothetical protein
MSGAGDTGLGMNMKNINMKIVNKAGREAGRKLDDIGIEAFEELPFMSAKDAFKAWRAVNTATKKAYQLGCQFGIYIACKTRESKDRKADAERAVKVARKRRAIRELDKI